MTESKAVLTGNITGYFDREIPYENQFLTTEQQEHSISVSEHGVLLQLSTALMFYSEHMNKEQSDQFINVANELVGDERKIRITEMEREERLRLPNIRLTRETGVALSAVLSRWLEEIFNIGNATVVVFDKTETYQVTLVNYRILIPISDVNTPIADMLEKCLPVLDFLYDSTAVSYDDDGLTTPVFKEVTQK